MRVFNPVLENDDEVKIKEYLNGYIKELQRHFNIPERRIRVILYKIYKELRPINFVQRFLSMVKSFCNTKVQK